MFLIYYIYKVETLFKNKNIKPINYYKLKNHNRPAQKKATPIGMAFLSFGKQGLVVGQRIQAVDSCFADRID